MSNFVPKILITSGEPSGIGPDVCLHLLNAKLPARISIIGDSVVFGQRASQLGLESALKNLDLISVPTGFPVIAGRLDTKNVPMVLKQLDIAIKACMRKEFHAMVTAPVHKGIINQAGHHFTGHTEYLAKKTQSEKPVMLLTCEAMRVALVTTHMPLADVPAAITQNNLIRVLEVLYNDLKLRFGIVKPVIGVCGLNPHAGEQGHLGRTEIDIIEPTLEMARGSGMEIIGPLPADTAFTPNILNEVDAILTMYHDQGLPVLKYASFGRGVNITLGLPIVRTSVDHGTALDLAGTGRADPGSMIAAVETAIEIANIEYAKKRGEKAKRKEPVNSNATDLNKTGNRSATLTNQEIQAMFDLSIDNEKDRLARKQADNALEINDVVEGSDDLPFETSMTSTDLDDAIKSMRKL